jgi:hypothetical protein
VYYCFQYFVNQYSFNVCTVKLVLTVTSYLTATSDQQRVT